jgi:ABC-2 type transport system ATP-binding protein
MRRIEIARALLHEPRLLLLDEPTVGLDIQSRASIVAFIRRLVADKGISVLWATHLIDEVDVRDHGIMLREGEVTAAGPLEAVLTHTGSHTVEDAFNKLCRKTVQEVRP